jgi:hypothetical protein
LQEPLNQVLNRANNAVSICDSIGVPALSVYLDPSNHFYFVPIQRSYRVSEPDEIVVASDHTLTAGVAGDVAANRNWRKLRKISDINQHAAQLKAFWAQNGNTNKIGRVFIKSELQPSSSSETKQKLTLATLLVKSV